MPILPKRVPGYMDLLSLLTRACTESAGCIKMISTLRVFFVLEQSPLFFFQPYFSDYWFALRIIPYITKRQVNRTSFFMDHQFWHDRWEKNKIGFHQNETNPLLLAHFDDLSLEKGSRVFVPLCGKTLDIGWLLAKGYRVAGVELSELAVGELFNGLGLKPTIKPMGSFTYCRATNIDIFIGDLFELDSDLLGQIDATFDRAALVALPEEMRVRYTKHLAYITENAPQLVITFDYDQTLMPGPPFSIPHEEFYGHYKEYYEVSLVASEDMPGGLKGQCKANEEAWILKPI